MESCTKLNSRIRKINISGQIIQEIISLNVSYFTCIDFNHICIDCTVTIPSMVPLKACIIFYHFNFKSIYKQQTFHFKLFPLPHYSIPSVKGPRQSLW